MDTKTKCQKIINIVEESCQNRNQSLEDICQSIDEQLNILPRAMADVFKFMSNMTLAQYVRSRKLMHAYSYLCSDEHAKIGTAAEIAGYENHSSFSTAFKKRFDITPNEARESKDLSKYEAAPTWEQLMNIDLSPKKTMPDCEIHSDTVFGIDHNKYRVYCEITDLQCFYDFSEYLANIVYEFSLAHGYKLTKCFDYFSHYVIYGSEKYEDYYGDLYDSEAEYYEKSLKEDVENPDYIYMFFEKGMLEVYFDIAANMEKAGIQDIKTLSDTALYFLANDVIDAKTAIEAADYYDARIKNFDEESVLAYIEAVLEYDDIEKAFENFKSQPAVEKHRFRRGCKKQKSR